MLKALLDKGWDYHDTESERLARELEAAAIARVDATLWMPLLHLSNHTIGEHLGNWPRARDLAEHVLKGASPAADTARAWGRLYVARFLADDPVGAAEAELIYLKAAETGFGAALLDMRFMLANAMVGSKRSREAALIYRHALDLAHKVEESPALNRGIALADADAMAEGLSDPGLKSQYTAQRAKAAQG